MFRPAFAFACLMAAALPAAAQTPVPSFSDAAAWSLTMTSDGGFRYVCTVPACGEGSRVIVRTYPDVRQVEPVADTLASLPGYYFSADTGVNEVIVGQPSEDVNGFAIITKYAYELISDPARPNPLPRYWTAGSLYSPVQHVLTDVSSSSNVSAGMAAANFDAMIEFIIGDTP